MSETVKVNSLEITDIGAVRRAVDRLREKGIRCSIAENEKPRMFYPDQHGVCPYVIRLEDGRYDVGLNQEADGNYSLVFDDFNREVSRILGAAPKFGESAPVGNFLQEYACVQAEQAAIDQGYCISESYYDEDGYVQLVAMEVE